MKDAVILDVSRRKCDTFVDQGNLLCQTLGHNRRVLYWLLTRSLVVRWLAIPASRCVFQSVNRPLSATSHMKSMAWCKTPVTPLLTHWSYCSIARRHQMFSCASFCCGWIIMMKSCYLTSVSLWAFLLTLCKQTNIKDLDKWTYSERIKIKPNKSVPCVSHDTITIINDDNKNYPRIS